MTQADLFVPIHGPHRRLQQAECAEASDGTVRIRWFPMGFPTMDDEDWRQFEVTPENAAKMVERANERLATGKKIRINYSHRGQDAKAGEARRFEADSDGVYGFVKWTPAARAAIKTDPSEWDSFSPEFFAERVMEEGTNRPLMRAGREVLRPYEITGGGLTNEPAMTDLRVAANKVAPADAGIPIVNAPSNVTAKTEEKDMALSKETLARLGLAEDAGPEDIQKAIGGLADKVAELTKPAPAVDPPPVAAAAQPAVDLTAKVAELEAKAAFVEKAERDRKIAAAVEKAIADGKVTAAQRDSAQTFAAANLEGFQKFVEALPVVAPVAKGAKLAAAGTPTPKGKKFANDFIGDAALALDPERLKLHQAALAYSEENKVIYAQAALAVSRK